MGPYGNLLPIIRELIGRGILSSVWDPQTKTVQQSILDV